MKRKEASLLWNSYARDNGEQPRYARCMIQWFDDQSLSIVTVALFPHTDDVPEDVDNKVCFYAESRDAFLDLVNTKHEDFCIVKIYWLSSDINFEKYLTNVQEKN